MTIFLLFSIGYVSVQNLTANTDDCIKGFPASYYLCVLKIERAIML